MELATTTSGIRYDRVELPKPDGSIEMYTNIVGAGRPHWRVVNTGSGMKIDADTRAFG